MDRSAVLSGAMATHGRAMRQQLWPAPPGEHTGEIEAFFDGVNRELAEVLLALDENGRRSGFAELSLRSHVDGCSIGPVGYLEGRLSRRQPDGAGSVGLWSRRPNGGRASRGAASSDRTQILITALAPRPTRRWALRNPTG